MNSLQQSSSEEFVASRISKSPTGRIRLLESIPERKNMQRVLHFTRYVDDCVIFVRSERGGKTGDEIFNHSGLSSPGPDPA